MSRWKCALVVALEYKYHAWGSATMCRNPPAELIIPRLNIMISAVILITGMTPGQAFRYEQIIFNSIHGHKKCMRNGSEATGQPNQENSENIKRIYQSDSLSWYELVISNIRSRGTGNDDWFDLFRLTEALSIAYHHNTTDYTWLSLSGEMSGLYSEGKNAGSADAGRNGNDSGWCEVGKTVSIIEPVSVPSAQWLRNESR